MYIFFGLLIIILYFWIENNHILTFCKKFAMQISTQNKNTFFSTMISIPSAVESVIKKRPFLESALVDGLINLSALARQLKPEIEKIVGKAVNDSAVIMALNRMIPRLGAVNAEKAQMIVENIGDITVRSNLANFTFRNSPTLHKMEALLLDKVNERNNIFCTFSQGISETTIIVSESIADEVEELFAEEQLLTKNRQLSLVTVKLPTNNTLYPGVYYYLFKELAWDNINIVEVVSTSNEFTIVINDNDVQQAFSILMSAKQRGAQVERM